MSHPAHVEVEAERLGIAPEALVAFYRGLKPLHPETFVCPECGKEYKTESGLENHIADKHSGGEDDDA